MQQSILILHVIAELNYFLPSSMAVGGRHLILSQGFGFAVYRSGKASTLADLPKNKKNWKGHARMPIAPHLSMIISWIHLDKVSQKQNFQNSRLGGGAWHMKQLSRKHRYINYSQFLIHEKGNFFWEGKIKKRREWESSAKYPICLLIVYR